MTKQRIAIIGNENIDRQKRAIQAYESAVAVKQWHPELDPQAIYDRIVSGNPHRCYVIVQTERTADGQFVPCIAEEGTTGYYKTDWAWGRDLALAEQLATNSNEKMGISQQEAYWIVAQSMRKEKK